MKLKRWLIPLALAGLLTLAACGGGDDSSSEDTSGGGETSGGSGDVLEISTPEGSVFDKTTLTAPANTEVTVRYLNNSDLPHNIHFFLGEDASAESLASTEIEQGPDNLQEVTFTTPSEPGSYYFQCDAHPVMSGELVVE